MGLLKNISLLFCFTILSSCSSVSYIVDQGIGQWKLLNRARPVDEVLKSPNTDTATKEALLQVRAAKKFAVEELHLKATKNYETYVALDDPYLSYIVTSADSLKLEGKTWKFPIIGEVPYLGFFDKAKAKAYATELEQQSPKPDVWIRGASAFSSLGWFPDPLYSSMIKGGNEREIFDLIIHESLHATLWIPGSVDFNESLASFVGMKGSLEWLKNKGAAIPEGQKNKALEDAYNEIAWQKLFAKFIEKIVEDYRRRVATITDKESFYAGLGEAWRQFVYGSEFANYRTPNFTGWNNATLIGYEKYSRDYDGFEALLSLCGNSLRNLVAWLVEENKKGAFKNAPLDRIKELKSESCPLERNSIAGLH